MADSSASGRPAGSALQRFLARLDVRLEQRREALLYRSLAMVETAAGPRVIVDGRPYLQFASNNYLGLANDPGVVDAAREAVGRYGAGSGASRLVAGSMALHHQLEQTLAEWKHAEAALVFSSGFMANLAVLTTLAGPGDRIVSDKLNHASLLDAAKFSGAECRTFPHLNYSRAAELLAREGASKFLVTDSVFSMDGDLGDLRAACDIAENANALVIVDEAHATGVLGETGAGVGEMQRETRAAVAIGTMSKALGSIGGYVTAPRTIIETLINEARPFIYTTALPPAASAAALAAIAIIRREPGRRERVLRLAGYVKRELEAMGFNCGNSATPIIPVMTGESRNALAASAALRERGLWIPAIRPPTVKEARLRISLMATHSDSDIARLLESMRAIR